MLSENNITCERVREDGDSSEVMKARPGKIVSINVSKRRGTVKTPVPSAELIAGQGIRDDAHVGFGLRQVSLLMIESIELQKKRFEQAGVSSCGEINGKKVELGPGVFAENFTTRGLDLEDVKVGDEFLVAGKIRLRVSQVGKECHTRCAIYKLAGDCIMPTQGIFCEVLDSGEVKVGDEIERV